MRNSPRTLPYLFLLITLLTFPLISAGRANAALLAAPTKAKSNSLVMTGPTDCPTSGCAAGQRLNFRAEFDLAVQYTSGANTQMCVYAPAPDWASSISIQLSGLVSGSAYTSGETAGVCSANLPPGYTLVGGAYATMPAGSFADQLAFVLQTNVTATTGGSVLVRIFQVAADGTTWTQSAQVFRALGIAPSAAASYVANDALACESYAPCYINSADDLPEGLGTGLKDAINAQSAASTVTILGNYAIKSNTVVVDRAHTLQGLNNSSLTYSGSLCSQPMLRITAGATLQNLAINGGGCSSTRRDLLVLESNATVNILSNTLSTGKDAIRASALHNANVIVRFNQISGNSGYAIWWQNSASTGTLSATANNLYGNRTGAQVECNNRGRVDHNFFGSGIMPSTAASQCTAANGKRLGAAIQLKDGSPGVDATRLTVTNTKTSYFNQQIAFQQPGATGFDIYVIDHGFGSTSNLPFLGTGTSLISACSPGWDIYLAEGSLIPSSLTVSIKYDLSPTCISQIESAAYCGQTNAALYPLLWYDPAGNVTEGWDNTGAAPQGAGAGSAAGQITTCNTANDEIEVTIDSNGRPNFINDLYFTPFIIGLPYSSVAMTNFTATTNGAVVNVDWQTSSENNISGFYVVRSPASNGPYARTSGFIAAKGSPVIGGIYNFLDSNLQYGASYYYKLEVLDNASQTLEFIGPASTTLSTATPTVTPTPTITQTPTRTTTPTITMTLSATYTRTPTRTSTLIPTRTRTPGIVKTSTRTLVPSRTFTPTFTFRTSTNTPTFAATQQLTPSKSATQGTPGSVTVTQTSNGYPVEGTPETTPTLEGYPAFTPTVGMSSTPEFTATITPGTLTVTAQARASTLTAMAPTSTSTGTPPIEEPGSSSAILLMLLILAALAVGGGLTWRYLKKHSISEEDLEPQNLDNGSLSEVDIQNQNFDKDLLTEENLEPHDFDSDSLSDEDLKPQNFDSDEKS